MGGARRRGKWWAVKTKNVWKKEEPQGRNSHDTVIYIIINIHLVLVQFLAQNSKTPWNFW